MKRSLLSFIAICIFSSCLYPQSKEYVLAKMVASVAELKADAVIGNGVCVAPGIVVCPISTIGKYSGGQVRLANGLSYKILGFTFADNDNDFTLLKIDYDSAQVVTMATYVPLIGQRVWLANKTPEGNMVLTEGKLSDNKDYGAVKLTEVQAASQFQAAGLPVMDSLGNMIGLSVASPIEDSHANFYIPCELIKKALAGEQNLRSLDMLQPFFENLAHISIAGKQKSKAVSEFLDQGIVKLRNKDYEGAIEKFTMAIRISPSDADAYAFRGQAKTQLTKYKEALDDFNKAVELQPEFAEALDMRGVCKAELGDMKGACEDWKLSFEKGYDPAFKLIKKFCDLE